MTHRVYVKIGDVKLCDAPTLFNLVSGNDLDLTGRCLFLADLGYFKLATFQMIGAKDQFFLSKLMHGVQFQTADGTPLDLMVLLKKNPESFHMSVRIDGCVYRMVGQRLPDEVVHLRLRKANRAAANKGHHQSITAAYRLFLQYAIFIAHWPESYDMDALYVLYRVRWQIELVFKTWKSIPGIHKIRTAKYERVMREVYGKLILAVLSTHFAVQPEFDLPSAIRLHRAMQWVKTVASAWACAIVRGARALKEFVAKPIANIQRFCKKHPQRNKPMLEFRLRQFDPLGTRKPSPLATGPAMA